MKFLKQASPRFYKYLLSYVLILAIVITVLGSIVYASLLRMVRNDIEKYNINNLKQIQTMLDSRFVELYRVSLEISENAALSKRNLKASGYDVFLGVQELRKYNTNNSYFDEIALYYLDDEQEKIYTSQYDTNITIFFSHMFAYENWNPEDFKRDVSSIKTPAIRGFENVKVTNVTDTRYLTHIYPIPFYSEKPNAVILFMVDESYYKDLFFNSYESNSSFAYIFDQNNNMIINLANDSDNDFSAELVKKIDLSSHKVIDTVKFNGEEYSIVKTVSDYNNFTYLTATPTKIFMSKFWTQRNIFFGSISAIFIIGIIISLILAIRTYKPLKDLTDKILKYNKKSNNKLTSDEFELISNMFKEVSSENRDLIYKVQNDEIIVKTVFILNILRGKFKDEKKITETAKAVNINFPHRNYCSIILYFDQFNISDRQTYDLIKYGIRNVSEELAQEIGIAYTVELENDRSIGILLNFDLSFNSKNEINIFAYKVKEFLKEHFNMTLTIGIGSVVSSLMEVQSSFLQAERSVNYRLLKGNDIVIFYEDIENHNRPMYKYPAELEFNLVMAVKTGDSEKVKEITKEIIDYIKNNNSNLESARIVCFGIINVIMKAVDDMNLVSNKELYNTSGILIVDQIETIDKLAEKLTEFCLTVCKNIEKQKESKNTKLRDMVLDIIQNELTNPDLTLEYIAGKCNVSSSYLSRYFSDQMGTTLITYINALRIEKVKTLLKDTDLTVREILYQVGYYDESNFIRKFKKSEGMTPLQYRKIVKKEENIPSTNN